MDAQLPLFDPDVLAAKLADAHLPGFRVPFSPAEAAAAGAFIEDALSEEDAIDSADELLDLDTLPLFGDSAP